MAPFAVPQLLQSSPLAWLCYQGWAVTDVSWASDNEWHSLTFAIQLAEPPAAQRIYQLDGQRWALVGEPADLAAAASLVTAVARVLDPSRTLLAPRPTWQTRPPSDKQARWLSHAFAAQEWARIAPYALANRGAASLLISWLRVRDVLTKAGIWTVAAGADGVAAALDSGPASEFLLATKAVRELAAWLAALAADQSAPVGLVDAEPGAGLSAALFLAVFHLPRAVYCRIDPPRIAAGAFSSLLFDALCGTPLFGGVELETERRHAILAMAAPGTILLLDGLATTRAAIMALLADLRERGVIVVVATPTATAAKLAKALGPTQRHTLGLVTRADVEHLVLPAIDRSWGLGFDAGEADWIADELFRLANATRDSGITWRLLVSVLAAVEQAARAGDWKQLTPAHLAALPRVAPPRRAFPPA